MTTDRQAESDRVRGYLNGQGEKYDFATLWRRVVAARLELLAALDGVSEEQAAFDPGGGDWSIRDVAAHILKSSQNCRRLVERLASGREGGGERVDPPREATDRPIADLAGALLEDGIAWSALTQSLPARPPLGPTAPHPMFGSLHARAWYLFQRVHDLDHANQVKAVKAAPGYPA